MKKNALKRFTALVLLTFLFLSSGCSAAKLPTPEGLKIAAAEGNAVSLRWEKTKAASRYRIFKRSDKQTDYKFLNETTALTFTDKAVEQGRTYFYKLQALNEDSTSEKSEAVSVFLPKTTVKEDFSDITEGKPIIKNAVRLDKFTAIIQPETLPTDASFEVWRADGENGSFKKLGESIGKIYYDETASRNDLFYQIRFIRKDSVSPFSPSVKLTVADNVVSLPVVTYHKIVTREELATAEKVDRNDITVEELEADLKWLKAENYTTVTASELVSFLEGTGSLPSKPILLILDDGKTGIYDYAYPLLKKYGMKASLALIGFEVDAATKKPDNKDETTDEFCTWKEISEMQSSGALDIISNTYGLHVYYQNGRKGANTAERETALEYYPVAQKDYIKFQHVLEKELGVRTEAFCYPYSARGEESDIAWFECGYKVLFAGDDESARPTKINYYWQPAGVNFWSGVARSLQKASGVSLEKLLAQAKQQ